MRFIRFKIRPVISLGCRYYHKMYLETYNLALEGLMYTDMRNVTTDRIYVSGPIRL